MLNRFKRRPSPSMVVALLALFVALGGTAVAANVLIKSSKQIKAGVVSRSDLRKNSVDSSKVANGSLGLDDLDSGAKGSMQTAGTQALEAFRKEGPQNIPGGKVEKVATLANIPPGSYAIFAKTVLTANNVNGGLLQPGGSVGGHCVLDATEGATDESRTLLGSPGASSPGFVSMQMTRTFPATGSVTVSCDVSKASWSGTDTTIIALRVGASPRQAVQER